MPVLNTCCIFYFSCVYRSKGTAVGKPSSWVIMHGLDKYKWYQLRNTTAVLNGALVWQYGTDNQQNWISGRAVLTYCVFGGMHILLGGGILTSRLYASMWYVTIACDSFLYYLIYQQVQVCYHVRYGNTSRNMSVISLRLGRIHGPSRCLVVSAAGNSLHSCWLVLRGNIYREWTLVVASPRFYIQACLRANWTRCRGVCLPRCRHAVHAASLGGLRVRTAYLMIRIRGKWAMLSYVRTRSKRWCVEGTN